MATNAPPITILTRDYVPGEGDPARIGDEVGVILQAWRLTSEGVQTDTLANIEESNMLKFSLSVDKNKVFLRLFFEFIVFINFLLYYSSTSCWSCWNEIKWNAKAYYNCRSDARRCYACNSFLGQTW